MTKRNNHEPARKAVVYALLGLWALMVLFPFYWMVLTSVKSYSAYNAEYIPQLFTLSPTLQNYVDAFTQVPLADYFVNTLIFTLSTTAIMLSTEVSLIRVINSLPKVGNIFFIAWGMMIFIIVVL